MRNSKHEYRSTKYRTSRLSDLPSRVSGYTLVELLVSVVIFTGIVATLFSVISAIRRTERFRDDIVTTTQAANYAFEPMVRALKEANAVMQVEVTSSTCVTIRGFYGVDDTNKIQIVTDNSNNPTGQPVSSAKKLVTVTAEKYYDPNGIGITYRWVKKEYARRNNQGSTNPTIVETTSYIANTSQEWPEPINECTSTPIAWQVKDIRYLTSSDVQVTNLAFLISTPLLKEGSTTITRNSPFVRLVLAINNPKATIAKTETIATTITPTFSYGEQRD